MPLYPNAHNLIRANLEALQRGEKVPRIAIGTLTQAQLDAINAQRTEDDLPLIIAEVFFVGRHSYKSRILKDGYTVQDVIDQVEGAMSVTSAAIATAYMTAIKNTVPRLDRLGNSVYDEAILECTRYRPNPELFSVMPKGDKIKPRK
jgi:hypothetical protein